MYLRKYHNILGLVPHVQDLCLLPYIQSSGPNLGKQLGLLVKMANFHKNGQIKNTSGEVSRILRIPQSSLVCMLTYGIFGFPDTSPEIRFFGHFVFLGVIHSIKTVEMHAMLHPKIREMAKKFSKFDFRTFWPNLVLINPKKSKKYHSRAFCAYKWVPIIA